MLQLSNVMNEVGKGVLKSQVYLSFELVSL